jgi:N-acetylmuramoyl-L-alanine amidase
MPSILIETGFLTNPREEEFLISENGQNIIASSIFTAFRKYKLDIPPVDQVQAETAEKARPDTTMEKHYDSLQVIKTSGQAAKDTLHIKIGIQPGKKDSKQVGKEIEVGTPVAASPVEFRVQVLASAKKLPLTASDFKGKKGFTEFYLDGYYKYMTGPVKTNKEAIALRQSLLPIFKGAFVVAFKDGRRIPIDDAINATK